ncbi:type I polyketide synthase [Pyxidicoccus parkwayensis]|uniref:Type I polyketide synthase n=1 Tax=Pyxidicoccus parkwayensis TaxID=2813578 RepID=A0ABX7P5E8_9BACT|nr:type I polyketide synthase [Pyxidicoccus parkwaysis]QSQ25694.1 type I polyketide synthase [Pyxidicoccus parkwaysis]
MSDTLTGNEIAIVGIAGRFPGARDVAEFWRNICDGVESFQSLTDAEALASGATPSALEDPGFVKVVSRLDDVAGFDAAFFGYSPREAELMDPQQRLFLECALEALEDSGHGAPPGELLVGVFGGQALSTYLVLNLLTNADVLRTADPLQLNLGNAGSFLTTRVSYKLDLRGPSYNVESACSTSLVAVHVACQSLLNHECDVALAGGVSINLGLQGGYRFVEGGILSPDGTCRPFDRDARGIVFGSGAGVVALRRLEDALAGNDAIYAVIKGSAVNNDGALRAGYTAPGVDGQASVISEALGNAGISAGSLAYVEAHGTGTALGDPIEVQALTRAFGDEAAGPRTCALGSVKANIGHLDAAAGVAGLIKAALALKHRKLPPSIHASHPHPLIPWESTPFYLNDDLREWKASPHAPRRAAVSSFGMGGTNAHVILEEAPAPALPDASTAAPHLLVLSARTPAALAAQTSRLAEHLRAHPEVDLGDVAWTLQVGRRRHPHRRAVIAYDVTDAVQALSGTERLLTAAEERTGRPVVFLFPGQGSQYVDMARGLHAHERVFREQVDRCAQLLRPHLGLDLRDVLYPRAEKREEAQHALEQTRLAQPALFTVEYALAKQWESWGLKPEACLGHSLGEYVAACLAGVFSLEDALALVARRGALMQSLPPGAMLSAALSETDLAPLLGADLSIAAVNAPGWCVVSGPETAVEALRATLDARGIRCRRLHTSHAFHSAMMDPILERFTEAVRGVRLQAPRLPWVSNVTGTWVTAAEATSPEYWARHLRQPVRFAEGLATLGQKPQRVFLEVGPGRALTTFAGQGPGRERALVTSLRHPDDSQPDERFLLGALGRLWLSGVDVDWSAVHGARPRRRVPLPTYPFERRRHWVSPGTRVTAGPATEAAAPSTEAPASTPSSEPSRPGVRTAYAAPVTEEEKLVAALWEEVLGVRPVGVHDDFFELGGHSLLATTVVGRLRETLGFTVPLQSLFESPTVGRMAELVARMRETPTHVDAQVEALLRMLAELCPVAPTATR